MKPINWNRNDKCYLVGDGSTVFRLITVSQDKSQALVEKMEGGEPTWVGIDLVRSKVPQITFKRVLAKVSENDE